MGSLGGEVVGEDGRGDYGYVGGEAEDEAAYSGPVVDCQLYEVGETVFVGAGVGCYCQRGGGR